MRLRCLAVTVILVAGGVRHMERIGLAGPTDAALKLDLKSGYANKGKLLGVNEVRLTATIGGNGAGDGTLVRDPNWKGHNEFGEANGPSSLLPIATAKVAFKERVVEHREHKGWRLFEVTGHGMEGRLFLAVRKEGIGTCRLVHTDDKCLSHEVVLMEQSSRVGK